MRLVEVRARAFRGFRDGAPIAFHERLTLVVAPNGAGKSSLLQAIEWALFGREVERKACGIAERGEWEAASRHGGEPSVALTLAGPEGAARLVRARRAAARATDGDELACERGGERALGAEAEAWLRASGAPDWETWRRAVCQHQETLRRRVVESSDRSAVLATLLGLGAMESLQRALQGARAKRVVAALDARLDELEKAALRAVRRPAEELGEAEARLTGLGVEARAGVALEIARRLAARAAELARELRFEPELPRAEGDADLGAVLAWARGFAREARALARVDERERAAATAAARLRAALAEVEPLDERRRAARERVQALERAGGERAARAELVRGAERRLAEAEEAARRADGVRALLADARALLAGGAACPVCGARDDGLARRLDAALAAGGDPAVAAAVEEARARLDAARRAAAELEEAERAAQDLERRLAAARDGLAGLVQGGADADLLGAARGALERLEQEARRLAAGRETLDARLAEHARDLERLEAALRWRAAVGRADVEVDLRRAPSWPRLQGALDAAAGLAADLDALAEMARAELEELSTRRQEEVNRALGRVYGTIVGDARADVRVEVRRTAARIAFELRDASGRGAVPVLNQSSIDALSLAMLFAQAEERAAGPFPWLVLDDPAAGMDAERQAGLARAIEGASARSQVIVAAPPGPLADALAERIGAPRRVVRLAPYDPARGVAVAEVEER